MFNVAEYQKIVTCVENFNMHYSLLLQRYKRFTEINEIINRDIDVITFLDIIVVQLRALCIENPRLNHNYTAQNLLRIMQRDDLAEKIDNMLAEEFLPGAIGFDIRKALKLLADKFICHYDSIDKEELALAGIIEAQLKNPYADHNLAYIMNTVMECIGKGLSVDNFKKVIDSMK